MTRTRSCAYNGRTMRVSKDIRDKAVDYSFDSIKYICEEIGPRESGMPAERKAQEWLKSQLLDNGWADEAEIEPFTVSRHGLVGFTKIVSVLLVLAAAVQFAAYFAGGIANAVAGAVTIVLCVVSLVITVAEFLMYKPFIDPLLPKTESGNVYARYKSSGETKRRIVFSGHCDSAYEWTLMKIKPAFMITVIVMCVVGVLASVALCIADLVRGETAVWSLVVTSAFIPFYVLLYFFCTFKVVVPGANDNLTGVLASVAVLKCLKESGIRFEHTEVAVLLTGSEEAGLRGAFAWARKHKQEIMSDGTETVFVGLETLRDWDHLNIYNRDLTGTVAHDAGAVKLLDKASAACGRPLKHFSVFFGASDAAAVTKEGLRATCLAGMDPTPRTTITTSKTPRITWTEKRSLWGLISPSKRQRSSTAKEHPNERRCEESYEKSNLHHHHRGAGRLLRIRPRRLQQRSARRRYDGRRLHRTSRLYGHLHVRA